MVVSDDDFHTKLVRTRDRLDVSNAGIHRDDECRSTPRELLNASNIHAIPFVMTVWNIIFKVRPSFFQEVVHQHCAGDAVAVVVAPDRDSLSRENRVGEPLRRLLHIRHQERVVEVIVVGGIKKFLRVFFCQNASSRKKRRSEVVIRDEFFAHCLVKRVMQGEHKKVVGSRL